MKKTNYIFLCAIFLFVISIWPAYIITKNLIKKNLNRAGDNTNHTQKNIYTPQKNNNTQSVVMPHTKIIYNCYYQDNGCIETFSELAPNFLIGLDEHKVRNIFYGWDINEFSSDKIVMQKDIFDKNKPHYVIGIKNGYVAVFYQNHNNNQSVKEITNTPIKSLSAEDQKRLELGIKICGDDKLISIMQDYES